MQWFHDLKLFSKLMLAVLVAVASMAVAGAFGYYYTHAVSQNMDRMYEEHLQPIKQLNEVRANFIIVHVMVGQLIDEHLSPQKQQQLQAKIQDLSALTNTTLATYEKGNRSTEERKHLEKLKTAIEAYRSSREKALALAKSGKNADAVAYMNQYVTEDSMQCTEILNELVNISAQASEKMNEQSKAAAQTAERVLISVTFAALLLLTSGGWLMARSLARRLERVGAVLEGIAEGDLTKDVAVSGRDEIGELGRHLNAMRKQLHDLVKQISLSAHQVTGAVQDINHSSELSAQAGGQISLAISRVAEGAEDQLRQTDETLHAVEDISNGIRQAAANTQVISQAADRTGNAVSQGVQAVDKAVGQMDLIRSTVDLSAQCVAKLGQRSEEIGLIVDTISGIAGQTNLLALNAAIEAARAGEMGRGFAVVAEEVRKLAEQSQESTKQIAQLIGDIQTDTNAAVSAMEKGTQEVSTGYQVVQGAGHSFEEISAMIEEMVGQVSEASQVMDTIAKRSQRVVTAMQAIDKVSRASAGQSQEVSAATQEQSASLEELASLSEGLASMAQEMEKGIRAFRV
ncbi:methyl-accepting chemotaxis protein [Azotosporobacter soli]|uniref:methyl-accepting chemotaxis protein n=1 Tax=Azotosporobacter soli TaxID=3055040 RepID=UPI0031FEEC55